MRPEKIRLGGPNATSDAGEHSATGTVREVIYVGMSTRFVVDLDAGGSLVVVQQNSNVTNDLDALRGQRVSLVWDARHEYQVAA